MSDSDEKQGSEATNTRDVKNEPPVELWLWQSCQYLSFREVVQLTSTSGTIRRLICGVEHLDNDSTMICQTFDPGILHQSEQFLPSGAQLGPSIGFPCPMISMITCQRLLRATVLVRKKWMRRAIGVERLNVIVDQRGITGIVPHSLAHILAANHRTLVSIIVEWHVVAGRNKCAQVDQLPDWWRVDEPAVAITSIQDAIENTSPTIRSPRMFASATASPISSPILMPASSVGSRMRSPSPACLQRCTLYNSQDSSLSSNLSNSFDSDEVEGDVAFEMTMKEFSPDLGPGEEDQSQSCQPCCLHLPLRFCEDDYIPHFVFESATNVELIFHNPAAIRFFAGCYFPACQRFQLLERHPDYEAFAEPDDDFEVLENSELKSGEHVEQSHSLSSEPTTDATPSSKSQGTPLKPERESGLAAAKNDAKSVFNILTRLVRGMSKLEKAYLEIGPKNPFRYQSQTLVNDARELIQSLVACRHLNSVTCRWPHILASELLACDPEDRPQLKKARVETACLILSAFPVAILEEMPLCLWEAKRVFANFDTVNWGDLDEPTARRIHRFLCLQEECLEHLTIGNIPQALLDVLSAKDGSIKFPHIKELDIETLENADQYNQVDTFLHFCDVKRAHLNVLEPIRLYLSINTPERLLTRFDAFYLEITSKTTIRNVCDNSDCRNRLHGIIGHIQSIKMATQVLTGLSFFKKPPLKFVEVWIDYPSTRHIAAIEKLYPLLKKYSNVKEIRIFVRFYPLFLGQSEIFSSRSPESHLLRRILKTVGFARVQEAEADIQSERRRSFIFQRENPTFDANISTFAGF
eukprot:Selendium_serpulae@DN6398_c0_g1_i1.p1